MRELLARRATAARDRGGVEHDSRCSTSRDAPLGPTTSCGRASTCTCSTRGDRGAAADHRRFPAAWTARPAAVCEPARGEPLPGARRAAPLPRPARDSRLDDSAGTDTRTPAARQRGGDHDDGEHRRAEGERDRGGGEAGGGLVDRRAPSSSDVSTTISAASSDGARRATTPLEARGRTRPPRIDRPGGLDRHRADRRQRDRDPASVIVPRSPRSAASAAATIGTPGGANGTRTSAMAAPSSALGSVSRRSVADEQRKVEGREHRVEPERLGSPISDPRDAPTACRPTSSSACGSVAPIISSRLNVPSPRLASAHEASTIVCASSARRSRPPFSAGATASPIGRKRV